MRITRVALSFFSVGFLAGTFEQAAGLGDAQRGQRASILVAEAALVPSVAPVAAPASLPLDGEPSAGIQPGPEALPQQPPAGHPLLNAGDAGAAEAVVAAFTSVPATGPAVLPALV